MGLELPEILNLAKEMETTLKGKTIKNITLSDRSASLIKQGMCNLDERKDEIIASKIKGVNTKGKWIFLEFDNGKLLLLGEIIGKFLYHKNQSEIPKKYHVLFDFDDGASLTFQSSLYAFLEVATKEELNEHKYAGNLGPSPDNDDEFSYRFFADLLSRYEKKAIKAVLNMQSEISGLGNGYINDILYEAKIHPKKKVSELKDDEKKKLYDNTVKIVKSAIKGAGSSDEYDLFGKPGNYKRIMDKNSVGTKCKRCGAKIVKTNVLGSSAYTCPDCQKI